MKDAYIKKFDSVYGSSDSYYGFDLRKEFTDYFNGKNLKGLAGLDLGCGEGRYSIYLARHGCEMLSVDRSVEGIKKLKKMATTYHLPIHAEVTDIEDFVFPDNRFDIIIAATILDHLPDQLRLQTISNIKQSLVPGGMLYVNVFTVNDPGHKTKMNAGEKGLPGNISDTAECMEYYFKEKELQHVFSDLTVLFYYEGTEQDLSHGRPHDHGWASMLARK